MKKIPDDIIFGHNLSGEVITYGNVRETTDEDTRIKLLKIRLETFLLNQIEPLISSKSAFPLCTMTCVGIETLGQIFIAEDKHDQSFQFVSISKKIDQKFGRQINKIFFSKLEEIWDTRELKNFDNYGVILYKFFRNTMIHGYRTQGVFLSYENTESIDIVNESAIIVLNPNWFWNNFNKCFNTIFDEVLKAQNTNKERINCMNYINNSLLK
jgi:hypothetical protein